MYNILKLSYKSIIQLLNTVLINTTRLSAKNPIKMMISSIILGSVTYIYLFNLAKASELLAAASYPSASELTSILCDSPNDMLFSSLLENTSLRPLPKSDTPHHLDTSKDVNNKPKVNLISVLQLGNDLHLSDSSRLENAWTYRNNLCNCDIKQLQINHDPLSKLKLPFNSLATLSFPFDVNTSQHTQFTGVWEQKVLSLSLDKSVPVTPHHPYESTSTLLWFARIIKIILKDMSERINSTSKIDLMIIITGYVLMVLTFLSLYIRMHRLGSKYILGTSIFMSGFFSFMLSFATVYKLGAPVSPILLSEAIPFLIVTVGFERPYKLTKSILEENSKYNHDSRTTNNAHHVISDAVQSIAPSLIRSGVLEILIFLIGAKSTLPGLREFCLLSAILIGYDMIFMFTWYISVLSLELRKIQQETITVDRVIIRPSTTSSSNPFRMMRNSVCGENSQRYTLQRCEL